MCHSKRGGTVTCSQRPMTWNKSKCVRLARLSIPTFIIVRVRSRSPQQGGDLAAFHFRNTDSWGPRANKCDYARHNSWLRYTVGSHRNERTDEIGQSDTLVWLAGRCRKRETAAFTETVWLSRPGPLIGWHFFFFFLSFFLSFIFSPYTFPLLCPASHISRY